MSDVFHLNLKKADLQGAKIAIIPGDPARAELIGKQMQQAQFLSSVREYTSWLGYIGGKPVITCSTGIGCPSTSIAVEELAQLGVTTFIRLGTTGAIQPQIKVGEVIISTGAVRLDGASSHFAPIEFPAVPDFALTSTLVNAAKQLAICNFHTGINVTSDTFYPGQERYDTHSGWVSEHLQGSVAKWQRLGVTNFEMEAATLFVMGAALKLQTAMLSGVIVNRNDKEIPSHQDAEIAINNAIAILFKTIEQL